MARQQIQSTSVSEPETRQERVLRKEKVIVKAAQDIFLVHGFYGTTMSMIAKASGVADGTLYTYFKNKEALARAVVSDFYNDLTVATQKGVDDLCTTEERLKFLARNHLTEVMDKRQILEMLPLLNFDLMQYGTSELFELNKNYSMIFDRIIKDGKAKGDIKSSLSPWIVRDIFFGTLDFSSRTMMIKQRESDIDVVVNEIIPFILAKDASPAPALPHRDMQDVTERLEALACRLEKSLDDKS